MSLGRARRCSGGPRVTVLAASARLGGRGGGRRGDGLGFLARGRLGAHPGGAHREVASTTDSRDELIAYGVAKLLAKTNATLLSVVDPIAAIFATHRTRAKVEEPKGWPGVRLRKIAARRGSRPP